MKKIFFTLIIMFISPLLRGQTLSEILKAKGSDIIDSKDHFGESVSLDGNYVMVGAPGKNYISQANTINNVGAVYVFKKDNNGNWSEVQKLVPNNISISNENDAFGNSIAISGKYAIIGARKADGLGSDQKDIGAVYVFEINTAGIWIEKQKLIASDAMAFDVFGSSLAIDGDNMLIGATGVDVDGISFVGGVYAFSRSSSGFWEEKQKIVPSELDYGLFGANIAIDGDKAIVGYFDDGPNQSIDRQGSAYIYEQDSTGTWNQIQKIVASDGTAKDLFGGSVAIEGNYVVVGAYSDKDEQDPSATINRGSIYIFEQDNAGLWNEKQKIIPSFHSLPDKLFGFSVSIHNGFIVVGAPSEDFDINTNTDEGAVYIYKHDIVNNLWIEN
ncbi:FG-GAP repeat protein [Aquimarina macrocephali]|uniref:FG-GAP repeat protein n=1 Tax=Aquimarina macrocephali TaxID=666563 RepID=UPI0004B6F163|nr:FG-GAP repeat protein [Aquimarina macrocephali]